MAPPAVNKRKQLHGPAFRTSLRGAAFRTSLRSRTTKQSEDEVPKSPPRVVKRRQLLRPDEASNPPHSDPSLPQSDNEEVPKYWMPRRKFQKTEAVKDQKNITKSESATTSNNIKKSEGATTSKTVTKLETTTDSEDITTDSEDITKDPKNITKSESATTLKNIKKSEGATTSKTVTELETTTDSGDITKAGRAVDSKDITEHPGWSTIPQEIKDRIFDIFVSGSTIKMHVWPNHVLQAYTRDGAHMKERVTSKPLFGDDRSPSTTVFCSKSIARDGRGLLGMSRKDGINFAKKMFGSAVLLIRIHGDRFERDSMTPFLSLPRLQSLVGDVPDIHKPAMLPDFIAEHLTTVFLQLPGDFRSEPEQLNSIERLLSSAHLLKRFDLEMDGHENTNTAAMKHRMEYTPMDEVLPGLFRIFKKTLFVDHEEHRLLKYVRINLDFIFVERGYMREACLKYLVPENKESGQWTLKTIREDTRKNARDALDIKLPGDLEPFYATDFACGVTAMFIRNP